MVSSQVRHPAPHVIMQAVLCLRITIKQLMSCLVLHAARGMTVDKSIQHVYIHAIRKAERFIYLENQCAVTCYCTPSLSKPSSQFLYRCYGSYVMPIAQ